LFLPVLYFNVRKSKASCFKKSFLLENINST